MPTKFTDKQNCKLNLIFYYFQSVLFPCHRLKTCASFDEKQLKIKNENQNLYINENPNIYIKWFIVLGNLVAFSPFGQLSLVNRKIKN